MKKIFLKHYTLKHAIGPRKKNNLYLDSGCARHMTYDKSMISWPTSMVDMSPIKKTEKVKLLVNEA